MADQVIRALFVGLVARAGGNDAVAALLEGICGTGHKGTVSKMCSGQVHVSVDAARAVEDFTGHYPITDLLAERVARVARPGCVADLSAQAAVTAGRAQAALFRALADNVMTRDEAVEVAAHMRSLRVVIDQIIDSAERVAVRPIAAVQTVRPGGAP